MKYDSTCELERACPTPKQAADLRKRLAGLDYVRVDAERQLLIGTDTHVLACVPIEIEDGDHVEGGISVTALKAAKKAGRIALRKGQAQAFQPDDVLDEPTGPSFLRPAEGGPPSHCMGVMPEKKEPTEKHAITVIYVDPEILWGACRAVGGHRTSRGVRLQIEIGSDGRVLGPLRVDRNVEDSGQAEAFAAVMPITW